MDNRWFREDRKLPKEEQSESMEASREALLSSTLLVRRLTEILEEEVYKTYTKEEDYEGIDWARIVFGQFQRRRTLKEIIKLLPRR